jgi:tetratricopeptide (TPR) repeat protein
MTRIKNLVVISGFIIVFTLYISSAAAANPARDMEIRPVYLAQDAKVGEDLQVKLVQDASEQFEKFIPEEILKVIGGRDFLTGLINQELKDIKPQDITNVTVNDILLKVKEKLEPEIKKKLVETILGEVNKLVPAEILGFVGGPEVIKTIVDEELEDVTLDNIQNIKVSEKLTSAMNKLEPEIKERLADFLMAKIQDIVPDEILGLISEDVDVIIRKYIQSFNIGNLQNFRVDQFLLSINDDIQPLVKKKLEELLTEKMKNIIPEEIMAMMPADMQKNILDEVKKLTLGRTQEMVSDQLNNAFLQEVQNMISEQVPLDIIPELQSDIEEKNKAVETDKIWTLMFSDMIDKASVEGNIVVARDIIGIFKVPINVNSTGRQVTVKPQLEWSAGNSYYLLIKGGLKSIGGKSIGKQVNIKFTVKEKPSVDDLLTQAKALISQNRLMEAIELANKVAAMAPDDYRALLISGKAKMAFDPQGAAEDLAKAFSLNPDDGEISVLKANNSDAASGAEKNEKKEDVEDKPLKLSTYN